MTSTLGVPEAPEVPLTPGPRLTRGISTHRAVLPGPTGPSSSRMRPPTPRLPSEKKLYCLMRSVLSEGKLYFYPWACDFLGVYKIEELFLPRGRNKIISLALCLHIPHGVGSGGGSWLTFAEAKSACSLSWATLQLG